MARRYDSRTTIFSPEGRLYQVEYAMEAINHAGTVIGILASAGPATGEEAKTTTSGDVAMSDASPAVTNPAEPTGIKKGKRRTGIVLAAEKKVTSKLLEKEEGTGEKIFLINGSFNGLSPRNLLSGVAGYTADANSLVNYSRNVAQGHLMSYDTDMPVEQMVKRLCDLKQGYTQFGGQRPFGVSFLIAGYDPHHQFQVSCTLYSTDPSGNYAAWKATCIGNGNSTATSLLRQDYKDSMDLDEAIGLALKVLSKTMDDTTLSSDRVEFAVISTDEETGQPHVRIYKPAEIDELLKAQGLTKVSSSQVPESETAMNV
ncbi:20S proteasome subunit alpha 3 [Puccinia sorghi]|uniref:20S proteasome subunit alpha 3 n=1 Tax=Puccinia sorghi TaxID=27349 RepID=A0A0L6V5S3_9BASI|nr:20S proteasome subunit alpha 3 [Puccinia sorghi]